MSIQVTSDDSLPLREIPGDYGFPFFGAIKDRYDFYYHQGQEEFFKSRIQKYQSTVFRTNMAPGPFISKDPKIIALLDANSFPTLFDVSKVEKKDVFEGVYMASTRFTGNYRICSFLDTVESKHSVLKGFLLSTLSKSHSTFIPTFRSAASDLFVNLEDELAKKGKVGLNDFSDRMSFEFVFRLFCDDKSPLKTKLGSQGNKHADKWTALQLAPLATLGLKALPNFLEDLVLHTFPLPFCLVKSDYQKLYDAFYESARAVLDEAEKVGIKRDEACHNLVFFAAFNAYGGLKIMFPSLIKWVGAAGESLHRRLADEIRAVVKEEGGVTFAAINKMSLTKSVVYETLRIEPPVPFQCGKAREDIVVQSHDASFLIKKGETIFGYQPCATKDPKIFLKPEEFVPDRFVGQGEKLIKYVYWSNGRETENPTADNKQCPGRDLVVLVSRLMLVELFLRYDTFTNEAGKALVGSSVTFKSLTKAD